VVNGHKSAAHTDSPDGDTGKTCLGEGMRCPSAPSLQSNNIAVKVFYILLILYYLLRRM